MLSKPLWLQHMLSSCFGSTGLRAVDAERNCRAKRHVFCSRTVYCGNELALLGRELKLGLTFTNPNAPTWERTLLFALFVGRFGLSHFRGIQHCSLWPRSDSLGLPRTPSSVFRTQMSEGKHLRVVTWPLSWALRRDTPYKWPIHQNPLKEVRAHIQGALTKLPSENRGC